MNKNQKIILSIISTIAIVSISYYYYKTQTLEYIVSKTEKSVFLVRTFANGKPVAQGSGFFTKINQLSQDKILGITNVHVIEGADSIVITTNNKKDFTISSVSFYSDSADLFIFEWNKEDVNLNNLEYLKIEANQLEKSQFVFSIGHPKGLDYSFTSGNISSIRDEGKSLDIIQTTAPISGGSSGSPLLSRNGRVIGVNTFSVIEGQNLNFAIRLNEKVFNEIIEWRDRTIGELQLKLTFKKWLKAQETKKRVRNYHESINPLKYVLENNHHFFDGSLFETENYKSVIETIQSELSIPLDLINRHKELETKMLKIDSLLYIYLKRTKKKFGDPTSQYESNLSAEYKRHKAIYDSLDAQITRLEKENSKIKILDEDSVAEYKYIYAIKLLDDQYRYVMNPTPMPLSYFEKGIRLYKNPFMHFGKALYHLSECNISAYIENLKEAEKTYAKWQVSNNSQSIIAVDRRQDLFGRTLMHWTEKEVKEFYSFFIEKQGYVEDLDFEIFKTRWFYDISKGNKNDSPVLLAHLTFGHYLDFKFNRNHESLNQAKRYLEKLKSIRFQLNIQWTGEIYFYLSYLINGEMDCDIIRDVSWFDPRQEDKIVTCHMEFGFMYGNKSLYDLRLQSEYVCN